MESGDRSSERESNAWIGAEKMLLPALSNERDCLNVQLC